MTEIEFVNREQAYADAERFAVLQKSSDDAKVESWFALQAVADQVGPASNVGVRGITWKRDIGKSTGKYALTARCLDGEYVDTSVNAPATVDAARNPERLQRAIDMLEKKAAEHGGRVAARRPSGTRQAVQEAIAATDAGRQWIAARTDLTVKQTLGMIIRVADTYGREGINPLASLQAHSAFLLFDDRKQLVRDFPGSAGAQAKAMSLRRGITDDEATMIVNNVSSTAVNKLSIRAGTPRATSRAILRAYLHGISKAQLARAVKIGAELIMEEMEGQQASAPARERVAA